MKRSSSLLDEDDDSRYPSSLDENEASLFDEDEVVVYWNCEHWQRSNG